MSELEMAEASEDELRETVINRIALALVATVAVEPEPYGTVARYLSEALAAASELDRRQRAGMSSGEG
jgi:hypothetical protein